MADAKEWIFVTDSLEMGGSQRAFVEILADLHKRFPTINKTAVLLYNRGPLCDELPKGIQVVDLGNTSNIFLRNLRRVWILIGLFRQKQPETVVSFLNYVNLLVLFCAYFAPRPRYMVVEQCAISVDHDTGRMSPISWPIRLVLRALYRKAWRVIAISHGLSDELTSLLRLDARRVAVIHNPVPFGRIERSAHEKKNDRFSFVFLGRLVPQKNVALLLEAFAALSKKEHGIRLDIVGDGPLMTELREKSKRLGVDEKITWHGLIKEPWTVVARCHCLILPTNFEGFANVLVEGLALGLPVISTDCPYGPRDILSGHDKAGQLVSVGNARELEEAMRKAVENREMDRRWDDERRAYAKKFSSEVIGKAYADLLTA